ncbi:MAG: hypothetical protein ACI4UU_04490 [Clostridia bacterium]
MIFEKEKTLMASKKFVEDTQRLPDVVKRKTIILIGPMGTGKSTIAKLLKTQIDGMDRIGLDNKDQLEGLYKRRRNFKNFKNFEFMLTGTILSSLDRPYIIDFGAGHSIYEDKRLKEQLQRMCANFSNVILLLPSENKEESRRILAERRNFAYKSHKDQNNWHFITASDNYNLATHIIYEENKTPEEVAKEIVKLIQIKERESEQR